MIIAQFLLILPIIAALTRQTVEDLWTEYREQLRSLNAPLPQTLVTLLWEGRFSLSTTVLAGFGRASGEVGAVMIVGGNIDHLTRHMANMEYGLILEWATSSVKDSDYLFHFVEIILFSALAATRGEVRETANSILTKMVATGELPKFENPIIRPIDVPK